MAVHADNLIANPATFAFSFLSEHASKKTKVALHGGGSDELFFGYDTYYANKFAKLFDLFPSGLFAPVSRFLKFLPASHKKLALEYKLKKFFDNLGSSPLQRHYHWRTTTEKEKKIFLRCRKSCQVLVI